MRILALLLSLIIPVLAVENITVTGIESMNRGAAKATTLQLQSELIKNGRYHVVTRDDLKLILGEQALQQAGATSDPVETGKIAGVRKALTGTLEQEENVWILSLQIIDVETGEVLNSTCVSVPGNLDKLMGSCGYALKKLLDGTTDGEEAHILNNGPVQVHVHEDRVSHEVHVYEHKAGTHDRSMFVPCNFCHGMGYMDELVSGRWTKRDCPMCARYVTYSGPETRNVTMTGKWIK